MFPSGCPNQTPKPSLPPICQLFTHFNLCINDNNIFHAPKSEWFLLLLFCPAATKSCQLLIKIYYSEVFSFYSHCSTVQPFDKTNSTLKVGIAILISLNCAGVPGSHRFCELVVHKTIKMLENYFMARRDIVTGKKRARD